MEREITPGSQNMNKQSRFDHAFKPVHSLIQKVAVILIIFTLAVSLAAPAYTGAFFTDEKPLTTYSFNLSVYKKLCAYMGVFVSCHNSYQLKIMIPPQLGFDVEEVELDEITCSGLTVNDAKVVSGDSSWQKYRGCLYGSITLCDIETNLFTWPHPLIGVYKLELTSGEGRLVVLGRVVLILPGFGGYPNMDFKGLGGSDYADNDAFVHSGDITEIGDKLEFAIPEWNLPEWEIPAWDYPGWYFPELDHPGEELQTDAPKEDNEGDKAVPETEAPESEAPDSGEPAPTQDPTQSPEAQTSTSPSQESSPEPDPDPAPDPEQTPQPDQQPDPQPEPAPDPAPEPAPPPEPAL